jgi:hypothetical protein
MRFHVRALFTQDDDGRLVAVNDTTGAPAPRFFLGVTAKGSLCWVRRDLDAQLAEELLALCEAQSVDVEPGPDAVRSSRFVDCLSRERPVERIWSGPAYECPPGLSVDGAAVRVTAANAELLSPYLEDWRVDAEAGVPMAASLHNGAAVSVCCSVRVTDEAHEAGVETHPDFRARGHASRAVRAWASAVRKLDCVPLYSTSWENAPSRALAASLGLVLFGIDLHIT